MKNRLAIICSYNPGILLLQTVNNIKLFYDEFDIVVVDSDSTNTEMYKLLPQDCIVEYCKNKNYELGAWKYAYDKYNNYKVYMFIQDSIIPLCRIPDLDKVNYDNGTIYSFHYNPKISDGGYFEYLKNVYNNTDLQFISNLDKNAPIIGAAHSSFILNTEDVNTILQLENAYIEKKLIKSKIDSWLSERTCGIMASTLKKRIDINTYFNKIIGSRL